MWKELIQLVILTKKDSNDTNFIFLNFRRNNKFIIMTSFKNAPFVTLAVIEISSSVPVPKKA